MKIKPNPNNNSLTKKILGLMRILKTKLNVIEEKPLTLFLNDQEIVTMMTVNDYPKYLALGYLLNQNMISKRTKIESVEYEDDIQTVVVRTKKKSDYQKKLKKKILTSGCAQGTTFGNVLEGFERIKLKYKIKIKS